MNKEIEISEMQNLVKNIFFEFHDFCVKNNITYYLAYGSLLGCVRHDGFIPWDDDIDVVMPRDDYEKFINYKCLLNEKYKIISSKNKEKWPYSFAKCIDSNTELEEDEFNSGKIGAYIDIFPLDGLPDNLFSRNIHYFKIAFFHKLLMILQKKNIKGGSFLKTIVKILLFPLAYAVGVDRLVRIIDYLGKKYKYSDSKYIASLMISVYGSREIMKKDFYSERVLKEFCGKKIYVSKNFDKILTALYGDYMVLPPVEKRISRHKYKIKYINEK